MTHMEMRRRHEQEMIRPFFNVDRRDYVSFQDAVGFVVGSVFYAILFGAATVVVFSVFVPRFDKTVGIITCVVALVGYIIFIFLYRYWYHKHCVKRYESARAAIRRLKQDWDTLESIYREEEEAARPTVNLDLLFPEGSLGENE